VTETSAGIDSSRALLARPMRAGNLPIKMVRENLESIPEFMLPQGYSLRWYKSGDEAVWARIQRRSDTLNQITAQLFEQQFGLDSALLAARQCYLVNAEDAEIGSATAWFKNDFEGRNFGRVHWVAILPEYQGRGLSKPLMTAICRRLRELGHEGAYLSTSSARLTAIKLYLQFGFKPLIRSVEEGEAWRELMSLSPVKRKS